MPTHLVDAAAAVVAAAGLAVAAAVWLTVRRRDPALPILLDFLTAAGLLRLSTDQDWQALGSAALIVVLRTLVAGGMGRADRYRSAVRRRR